MKRCTRCVMPESFPGIAFDAEGVCSLCAGFGDRGGSAPSLARLREKFAGMIDAARAGGSRYHAVVAFSGGKDSTFLIHWLKERYALEILAFTFDNGFMSDASFENMRSVLNALNVDHEVARPRRDVMKQIFRHSATSDIYPDHLTRYGSAVCISCIRMVLNLSLRIAIEKQIPLVMLGNSPGQLLQSENEIIFQDNKIPYELRRRLFGPLAERAGEEVWHYLMLDREAYGTKPFPHTVNPYPLIGYDEREIYRTIKALGWRKPEDVDPNSTNCRLNALGIARHRERHGFHPYDYEMSMLVRLGQIDRDEALARLEDPEGKVPGLAGQIEGELWP